MIYLVDQSGKIEQTNKDTVIGAANGKNYALKLPAKTKRQLQKRCRESLQGKLFVYRTFAALVFLIIKENIKAMTDLVIDIEYPGKEKVIREVVLELLRKESLPEPNLSFGRIGNNPKAHFAAYDVFIGRKKADKIITLAGIEKLVIKRKRPRPKRLKST